ncbi:hypothetical protein SDC9_165687 [bioreactor metagenome]|uniref:Uncharacterized protein n=1 Tax=bioreactor metagenome TaxID=1076179 RepID=A0A645FUY0_9ZZZZ
MILHHGVGLEDIGTDLAAPLDLFHFALDVSHLLFLLALTQLDQARAQHLHGLFLILHLAALILAGDDDARRHMCQTHCGIGLVNMLAAGAC